MDEAKSALGSITMSPGTEAWELAKLHDELHERFMTLCAEVGHMRFEIKRLKSHTGLMELDQGDDNRV